MYRNTLPKQEVYVLCDIGGLGDILAQLPVIPYILDNHPHIYLTYWLGSFMKTVAKKSLPVTDRLVIRSFDEKHLAKGNVPVKKFSGNIYTNLANHMTTQAYDIFCNTQPNDVKYYNYLPIDLKGVYINRFELPENYVVIPTGYTAPVREFHPDVVNNIIDYVISKNYTPVFLGRETTKENSDDSKIIKGNFSNKINFDKGINLINKTDMLESTKIIKGAKTIVGLDNGLLHLAATTDIAIVGGFTTVNPEHRLPYRHNVKGWNYYPVVLTEDELKCRFCQSNMTFLYDFNMTKCFYKDYKCITLLSSDKYINELEKIL